PADSSLSLIRTRAIPLTDIFCKQRGEERRSFSRVEVIEDLHKAIVSRYGVDDDQRINPQYPQLAKRVAMFSWRSAQQSIDCVCCSSDVRSITGAKPNQGQLAVHLRRTGDGIAHLSVLHIAGKICLPAC